jgi:hypothetical protein
MSSRPLSIVLVAVLLALTGVAAHADAARSADPAPAVEASPAEVAPDCGTAAVDALFGSAMADAIAQSCTYSCFGTSPQFCPQFPSYTVSCINGCCVYSLPDRRCDYFPECFSSSDCDEGEVCSVYQCCH